MPAPSTPCYAGFWRRSLAHLIDSLIVTVLATVVLGIYLVSTAALPTAWLGPPGQAVQFLLLGALTVWLWRRFAATPGKLALHLVIADAASLGPASLRQLSLRYLAYLVSMLPLGLGFLWIAFDPRKQGWHDKLAGTVVLRRPD